mgnify:CR=1 FL=1
MEFTNGYLSLSLSEENPAIELSSRSFAGASLRSQFSIDCRVGNKEIDLFNQINTYKIDKEEHVIVTHTGRIQVAQMLLETEFSGLSVLLKIGLFTNKALAGIQVKIVNHSDYALTLHRISPILISAGELQLGRSTGQDPAFFSQGWQSWSHTSTYGFGEKQRTSALGPFQNPMVANPGTPQPKRSNVFTGDMFGVLGDRESRVGLLAGFLSQREHFGSLEADLAPKPSLHMWANGDNAKLPPGQSVQTDWAVMGFIDLDAPDPMGQYLSAAAVEHNIKSQEPVPVGWCSWYQFYEDISQDVIETNLDSVVALKSNLPLPLFQIDDGFETYPGDWFDFDPAFPEGVTPLAKKAKHAGLIPGLWLAPFIVHPKAKLVREHPDWLLRNKRGKPVNAGFVWNKFTYALDLTNTEALDYVCSVISTAVNEWGFEYLKLDFLYAAALKGVFQDPTRTRAQVLRMGLEALRKAAGPDVTMLACGCPLGSALGLFEAMRISADVSGHWNPHFPPVSPILKNEPHMPAARNALHNIITRAHLHRHWWINDPDCLLVRPDTKLTLAEVQTLATAIGLTGGSLLLSDDLPQLSKARLKFAQVLLPVIDQRAQVVDWFDTETPQHLRVDMNGPAGLWHLLAIFNWDDEPTSLTFSPEDFQLPKDQIWWAREFWLGTIEQMGSESPITFNEVPAHGVRVIAVRPYDAGQPAYLGGDLHLSQGMEVSEWQSKPNELVVGFSLGRKAAGTVNFYLPWKPAGVWFGEETRMMQDLGRGVFSVEVENLDEETLIIRG